MIRRPNLAVPTMEAALLCAEGGGFAVASEQSLLHVHHVRYVFRASSFADGNSDCCAKYGNTIKGASCGCRSDTSPGKKSRAPMCIVHDSMIIMAK